MTGYPQARARPTPSSYAKQLTNFINFDEMTGYLEVFEPHGYNKLQQLITG
jgi:hypothetical protein